MPTIKDLSKQLANRTFEDLKLSTATVQAVRQEILDADARPTEIQALTIPAVMDTMQPVLCAAETGSGKTLAYLLPVIEKLKKDENKKERKLDRPRAVILVPTRELVAQVRTVCKALSHTAKFRAVAMPTTVTQRWIDRELTSPIDILIATPSRLLTSVKHKTISLAALDYLVVDEADSLFDGGWGDDVRRILKKCQKQTIVVSATLPRSVSRALDELFTNMLKITTPSLHRSLPNLKQSFVDLQPYSGNRQQALLQVLKKNIKDTKTLVFCNTVNAAELLHDWMVKNAPQLGARLLYKDADRAKILEEFGAKGSGVDVLISTDIASRGIDTTFVEHVVCYDFPKSAVDYLHRVGRTARAGRTGKATALVGRKDRMMADRIRRSIREGSIMT